MKKSYSEVNPYITKDLSEIRELLHPDNDGELRTSLAEAVVAVGGITELHCHVESEEIYHILSGYGDMNLSGKSFAVTAGDSILIKPGEPHRIINTGDEPLRILCICTPPYSHGDTELL
ncbi:cupin domain-containing protein [Limisalsivibrio acetivorans]|uniref:cupin domain-containing protein n=1 Tax=Limisalsivibrio acetivorans TaxID=1304888 RepID=UPI0003B3FE2F|nr:cupin domain-containing protein [Limisalsivibrio acetivorans]